MCRSLWWQQEPQCGSGAGRRLRRPGRRRAIAASFLAAPYVLNHDAVVLTAAAALLARAWLREGLLPGERALLILACLAPGAMLVWPPNLMVPSAALLLLLLAVLRARRDALPATTVASAVASAPARA